MGKGLEGREGGVGWRGRRVDGGGVEGWRWELCTWCESVGRLEIKDGVWRMGIDESRDWRGAELNFEGGKEGGDCVDVERSLWCWWYGV